MPSDQDIQLSLSRDEALVLFEFVSRYSETDRLSIADPAEKRALWNLCCLLEREMTEPLVRDYKVRLAEARTRLSDE